MGRTKDFNSAHYAKERQAARELKDRKRFANHTIRYMNAKFRYDQGELALVTEFVLALPKDSITRRAAVLTIAAYTLVNGGTVPDMLTAAEKLMRSSDELAPLRNNATEIAQGVKTARRALDHARQKIERNMKHPS